MISSIDSSAGMASSVALNLIVSSGDCSSNTEGRCSLCEPLVSSPHIYSFNNLVVNVVEDYVGVRVLSITKHKTFMCFRCKFRIVMRISNPTFSTEDFEITYIRFLVSEEFICSLLEEFVKIYSVDDMARSINCINPETTRGFVLIEHSEPSQQESCSCAPRRHSVEEYKEQITHE